MIYGGVIDRALCTRLAYLLPSFIEDVNEKKNRTNTIVERGESDLTVQIIIYGGVIDRALRNRLAYSLFSFIEEVNRKTD